jgi:rhodanese-related sulfurtransferase
MLKVTVSIVLLFVFAQQTMASEVPRMTKEKLKSELGSPNLVVVDVRTGKDWKASEVKIKGAVRGEVYKIESWAKNYSKDTTLVIYCA